MFQLLKKFILAFTIAISLTGKFTILPIGQSTILTFFLIKGVLVMT